MKARTTIYVNKRLIELAQAAQINVSAICESALEEATGFTDPVTLAGKILRLKAEIRLLTDIMDDHKDIQDRFPELLAMFEKRHNLGTERIDGTWKVPTEDQDLTWIRAVKKRYGMADFRDRELLKKLWKGAQHE